MPKHRTKYPDATLAKALRKAVKVSNTDPRRRIVWNEALVLVESRGPTGGSFGNRGGGLPPARLDDPDLEQRQGAINDASWILNSAVSILHMADDYRQRLAECARFFGGSPASDWQDVQRRLLEIARHGEAYTSLGNLADRFKCAKGTVTRAVNDSPELCQWRGQKVRGAPKAQSLSRAVTDNTPSAAPNPADVLAQREVDDRMKMLIAQAPLSDRKRLVTMDKDKRREYVRLAQEQGQDLLDEDFAPKGNRILGRKP